jgi:putative intracellular protease/amidase
MPTAWVLLAEGAEEIETVAVVDVLRRAEVKVILCGLDGARAAYLWPLTNVPSLTHEQNAHADVLCRAPLATCTLLSRLAPAGADLLYT